MTTIIGITGILIALIILWAILSAKKEKKHQKRIAILTERVEVTAKLTAIALDERERQRKSAVEHRMSRRHA